MAGAELGSLVVRMSRRGANEPSEEGELLQKLCLRVSPLVGWPEGQQGAVPEARWLGSRGSDETWLLLHGG